MIIYGMIYTTMLYSLLPGRVRACVCVRVRACVLCVCMCVVCLYMCLNINYFIGNLQFSSQMALESYP